MSKLTDLARDEHAARMVLATVARPNDPATGALLRRVGVMEVLRLAEDDGPLPGMRRADGAVWREELHHTLDHQSLDEVIDTTARQGFQVLIPGDAEWPAGLNDLGDRAPYALWMRGEASLLTGTPSDRATMTGARASTAYGEHVASDLVHDLVSDRCVVVSGAAYGIDAAAHRAALIAGGGTIAVMANGLDRPYPAGHADLLEQIGQDGLLLSEVPPGAVPTRQRFLDRHRILAALSGASIVVEVGSRSGAIGVVEEARALGRKVGAVPGPVTSAASQGTNLLLRDRVAHAILSGEDAIRLLNDPADHVSPPSVDQVSARSTVREARSL